MVWANGPRDAMSNDREYFECLYRAHYAEVFRFAARRSDTQSAREITAETFLAAWRRLDVVRGSDARVWLFAKARNLLANERRRQARSSRLTRRLELERTGPPADPADTVVDRMTARALLESLRPKEREALQLTEWERLDVPAAARVAGCSVATFRVRLHRARRRLTGLDQQTGGAETTAADPVHTSIQGATS